MIGIDQVAPLSCERITITVEVMGPPGGESMRVKTLTTSPLGSTAITFPMVWLLTPGS